MGSDAPIDGLWPIQFKPNVDVPAFGVMVNVDATTNHGEVAVTTKQYEAADSGKLLYINGPTAVTADSYGRCSTATHRPVMALGSASLSANEAVGPTDGSWELSEGGSGFTVVGESPVDGAVVVQRGTDNGYDRCTCTLKGDLETTDSTATVDNVKISKGTSPLDDPDSATEELTVDGGNWEGNDNADCLIEYNYTTEKWTFYDIWPCKT